VINLGNAAGGPGIGLGRGAADRQPREVSKHLLGKPRKKEPGAAKENCTIISRQGGGCELKVMRLPKVRQQT